VLKIEESVQASRDEPDVVVKCPFVDSLFGNVVLYSFKDYFIVEELAALDVCDECLHVQLG
jgi:hypothetical protein